MKSTSCKRLMCRMLVSRSIARISKPSSRGLLGRWGSSKLATGERTTGIPCPTRIRLLILKYTVGSVGRLPGMAVFSSISSTAWIANTAL